ncbi:VCBS repeat-containing protein [Actinoplanes sp. NPDC049596]|uniref:FG-GAP repeat domain-containing protein n=1 Tax=unclassified Actinoplanes TaxID=2626549 RepID=UPI00344047BA
MKNVYRRTLAALVGGALAVAAGTSVPAPAMAAAAASESEVAVVAPEPAQTYTADVPVFAGETGYLHQRTFTSPFLWTRYADGVTTAVPELAGSYWNRLLPTGGDHVWSPVGSTSHPQPGVFDLATMTWHDVTTPAGYQVRPVGDVVVLRPAATPNIPLIRRADGTTTPITGVPEGTTTIAMGTAGDAESLVLSLSVSGVVRHGLLDLASGRVALLPAGLTAAGRVVLTADRIGLFTATSARTFSRAEVMAGTATQPETITLPKSGNYFFMGLAGRDLIAGPVSETQNKTPMLRYRAGDPTPEQIAPVSDLMTVQAPDGVIFVGGTGPADWAARKATAAGQEIIAPLAVPRGNAGISLTAGRLRHVHVSLPPGEAPADYHPYSYLIGPDGITGRVDDAALSSPATCQTGAACIRTIGGHDQGMPWMTTGSTLSYQSAGRHNMTSIPSAGATVVDASYRYTIVNGTNPAKQYVVLDSSGVVDTGPVTGAALWFRTLWRATRAGTLQATTLPLGRNDTATAGLTVSTGAACTATEVQATAKYLYWSCGATGPAGVYDLTRQAGIALPAGRYLLGDNYVVRHDADGSLIRFGITGGRLGEPAVLATFDRGGLTDDRTVSWAVDKFGGDVAWVDSGNAVHVVDPGVAPSAAALWVERGDSTLDFASTSPWSAAFRFTRPTTSSRLVVTQVRTGRVVLDVAAGPLRVSRADSWSGLIAGRRATSGTYRWQLTAVAGGATTSLGSGTFGVYCGTPTLHSFECSGQQSVLGVRTSPSGEGHWLLSRPSTAALMDNGRTETWDRSQVTAMVPFGDVNRDLKNDLLVRYRNGTLRAYLGSGQANFGTKTSVAVPGSWNRFNVLVHTGDLTGDGVSDLIVRETSTGRLFRYTGNGKGGFSSAAAFAGTYKGASRFVGPGDINGDGRADLLVLIGTTMYAWWGNGAGGFTPGYHLIGTGYLGFNAIIGAGDLNEDGKNDLLLRNSAGTLYRKLGDGKGGFGALQLVGSGYQKYAGIY